MDSVYTCSNCHHESPFYLSECPECGRGHFTEAPPAPSINFAYAAPGTPGEPRVCYKCDFEVLGDDKRCPRCGHGRVLTRGQVQVLGWVLLLIGAFLFLFMGGITLVVANIIAHTDDPGATTRFDGGTKEAALIFGIFGLVLAFGFASMVAGVSQIRHGRRNKRLVRLMLGLVVVLVVLGELVYIIL